jgi:zona occludens toxin
MITLITGGPGLGKTALVVSMLQDQFAGRPIFTNINGLKLPHGRLPRLSEWTKEIETDAGTIEHHFTFPPGCILVLDECQSVFPPRANGSRVPPHVAALATHRHEGMDIILITQGSGLLDTFALKQVKGGLHVFLKSSYIGRFRYERSERFDEESRSDLALCAKRKYKLPAHVFDLYKSSELHTKPPRRKLPMAAYGLLAALGIGGALAYKAGGRIDGAINPEEAKQQNHAAPGAPPALTGAALVAVAVPYNLVEAMTPKDAQNPLSAPLYAAVVPPVVAPQIQGCIASSKACTCYSQQQTPVWLPEPQCRERAAGRYFDPYQQPAPASKPREIAETKPQTAAKEAGSVTEVQSPLATEKPSATL